MPQISARRARDWRRRFHSILRRLTRLVSRDAEHAIGPAQSVSATPHLPYSREGDHTPISPLGSEDLLRLVTDVLPVLISYVDREERYCLNNLNYERWFGHSRESIRGKHLHEVLGDEAYAEIRPAVRRVLAGETVRFESRLAYRDGGPRDVDVRYIPHHVGGKVAGFFAFVEDVSERKRADEARARLAAIVEDSNDAIIGKTLDGIVTSWNAAATAIYGWEAHEIVGKHVNLMVPPDLQGEEEHILMRLRQGERIESFETERITKDGRRISVSLTVSPIRDSHGRIVGASKIARDITQRNQTELALRESEERLRLTLRGANAGTWRLNVATGETVWSDELQAVYGHHTSMPQTYGAWIASVHPDDRARVQADFERRIASAEIDFQQEFRIAHPTRGVRWILDIGHIVRNASGAALELSGINIDITERRLAEESLRDSDRKKDEFLAVLAHELRNPLSPLSNGLQIAQLAARSDPTLQRTVAMMQRQLGHLVRLVDDLLDVSRISRGKIELRRQRCRLTDVLANSIDACRSLIEAHGHRLRVNACSGELDVDGDSDRLVQVFSNLLSNAAKYTDYGGEIEVNVDRDESHAIVRIVDNGIGIAPNHLHEVFEMFTQVRVHQGRAEGGLGIGLSLVKTLVEMHGGTVTAASAGPGQGSTFAVRLPLAASVATVQESSTKDATPVRPRHILVVDDNVDAAESLSTLLRLKGHHVTVAHDGLEAVEQAESSLPDLVFMDLGMPRMDGIEAASRIRMLPGGADCTIVALTGWGQPADRERTRAAGIDRHLVKPVAPETVDGVLAEVGSGRRPAVLVAPSVEEGSVTPTAAGGRG